MVRIRKIVIRNFRSIRNLEWVPAEGINCLIGPGDSGKSSILDAIDLCLGARRNVPISDTDFYGLDVAQSISITLTLGALPDALKNIDIYGEFLQAFDLETGLVDEEPRRGLETVLVFNLSISGDLEPVWTLVSQRAQDRGIERSISWKDRAGIAPARLGSHANSNLSWTRGSVLNRLSEERTNLGAELARAAREARASFGDQAADQLENSLRIVTNTASSLGVPVGASAKALLDAHSVSISDGAIALHNEDGIPLRSLGTGSSRLLIAGLQRAASESASIILADEVEYGLEPHRLMRLLNSLGAKETQPPLQVFMCTHSPVAVRELNGDQIFVVRSIAEEHEVHQVGTADDVQSTIRKDPEAFLAKTVIVCEGASEVGFVRGLDEFWSDQGHSSLQASGVAYVDVGGSEPARCFNRGRALLSLGYRVIVLVDSDKPLPNILVETFVAEGGNYIAWSEPRALEDELFMSLADIEINALIERAKELKGQDVVNEHIRTKSEGRETLDSITRQALIDGYTDPLRSLLGKASQIRQNGWFKSVTKFEGVARDIVGPGLDRANSDFRDSVLRLFRWAHGS